MSKKITVQCDSCGKDVVRWPSQIKGRILCSSKCDSAVEHRSCSRCGTTFVAYRSQRKRTCGRKCPGLFISLECEMCRDKFTVLKSRPSPRFCTDKCRRRWFSTHFVKDNSPHWKGGINPNYYSAKRRAIMSRGDNIDHLVVFEAFNWKCHICGNEIDKSLRFPNKMAATLDHIIPISKGGQHVWDNVAPAHAMCNFTKSNKVTQNLDSEGRIR